MLRWKSKIRIEWVAFVVAFVAALVAVFAFGFLA